MCDKHQQEITTPTTAAETPAPLAPQATAPDTAASSSCCGHSAASAPVASPLAAPTADADDLAECPVMPGSIVNKADAEAAGLFRDHKDQRYWFCCAACGPMWDADPDKYAAA